MTIKKLFKIIQDRRQKMPKDSYVASLFRLGEDKIIQKVGEEATRQHHFPDIFIRNSRVTITLTTHEARGLTYEDFKLAKIIEQLV